MHTLNKHARTLCRTLTLSGVLVFPVRSFAADTYAPWLTQIGVTDTIESAASWGKGQLIVTVDTGIQSGNNEFASGQVSASLSGCAAVTFRCSNGVNDDNSHGTAVASIAAGNRTLPGTINYGGYLTTYGSYIGVAPNANIAAEKVLNASGTGTDADVANGIIKAANAGASVINLSLTWLNTASIVSAINYAASKGSFIVWAGGNSSTALLSGSNTNGLTSTAIEHLIFAGSVSAKNSLSTFSNTPGTGSLVNTSGGKTAYETRWIMAPGENIIAPYATAGANSYAAWTGTSMSTPMVSGSLSLLMAAWPILRTNGTAADLLLATATDLGVKGTDTSYGTGLVNLTTAFQPYGTLSVTEANGKSVAVSTLTGALISSGALGSLPSVQARLASYTALDSYSRNYTVNLSGLIKTKPSAATVNPLPSNANTGPNKVKFTDGSLLEWQVMQGSTESYAAGGLSAQPRAQSGSLLAILTEANGTTYAFGYGNVEPSAYSYTRALFDSDDAALASSNLLTDLTSLTVGGEQIAYGLQLGKSNRLAVSYSNTATQYSPYSGAPIQNWMNPSASAFSVGLMHRFSDSLQMGVTLRSLNETNSLLGTAYDPSNMLSLGSSNRTNEIGLSALYAINRQNSFFFEVSQARTQSSGVSNSLFSSVDGLTSQSWGVSFVRTGLFNDTDHLTLTLKQPLCVTSGSAQMAYTQIDPSSGTPSVAWQNVSLTPGGRETDMLVNYATPLFKTQQLSLQAGYIKDYQNTAGANTPTLGVTWSMRF
jgi:hypothetical protein